MFCCRFFVYLCPGSLSVGAMRFLKHIIWLHPAASVSASAWRDCKVKVQTNDVAHNSANVKGPTRISAESFRSKCDSPRSALIEMDDVHTDPQCQMDYFPSSKVPEDDTLAAGTSTLHPPTRGRSPGVIIFRHSRLNRIFIVRSDAQHASPIVVQI